MRKKVLGLSLAWEEGRVPEQGGGEDALGGLVGHLRPASPYLIRTNPGTL